jgi:hypothetical protein
MPQALPIVAAETALVSTTAGSLAALETASAAEALAALDATAKAAAATEAATTAATAAKTATPILETTAGLPIDQVSALTQGGINPATVPPVPPGAPLPPATPLPPAGGTPFTVPGAQLPPSGPLPPATPFTPGVPPGTLPPAAPPIDPVQAQLEQLANRPPNEFLNKRFEPLADAAQGEAVPIKSMGEQVQDFQRVGGPNQTGTFENVVEVTDVGEKASATANGWQTAMKAIKDLPYPVQALGTLALSKSSMSPDQPKQKKYKATPYSGLSPDFEPGGPSYQLYGGPPNTGSAVVGNSYDPERFQPGGASNQLYGGVSAANGGLMGYDVGGPVEQMSNTNAGIMPTTGQNNMYPMSQQRTFAYANPSMQNPVSQNVLGTGDAGNLDSYTGMPKFSAGGTTYEDEKKAKAEAEQRKRYSQMMHGKSGTEIENDIAQGQAIASRARGSSLGIIPRSRTQSLSTPSVAAQTELAAMFKGKGMKSYLPKMLDPQSTSAGAGETEFAANGGIMHSLGGYSDGGRLLRGPGDGVSDSIPAQIGDRQPARLADGEFVIPARIVSELGNGSTEAGARALYAMMERIQKGRKKSVGKGKVAVDSKSKKHLPA